MISIEIMLVMAFTLLASAMYIMYQFLNGLIEHNAIQCYGRRDTCVGEMMNAYDRIEDAINSTNALEKKYANDFSVLKQQVKDNAQSSAICSKSGLDKVNSRLTLLEKEITSSKENNGRIKARTSNAQH